MEISLIPFESNGFTIPFENDLSENRSRGKREMTFKKIYFSNTIGLQELVYNFQKKTDKNITSLGASFGTLKIRKK